MRRQVSAKKDSRMRALIADLLASKPRDASEFDSGSSADEAEGMQRCSSACAVAVAT
jgi:hypothetical protein